MSRWEDRQVLRALGWRGSKAKRSRRYVRPEFTFPRIPAPSTEEPESTEE